MLTQLIILGASARACAASALRWKPPAGDFRLITVDLFADRDLQAMARTYRCHSANYPQGLVEIARQQPPSDWMYTGGLENYPRVVRAISRHHRLLGCSPDVLQAVRNPWRLDSALAAANWPRAAICARHDLATQLGDQREWLVKLARSSGGFGVSKLNATNAATGRRDAYGQLKIAGQLQAGLFVANGRESRLLGVTRSWTIQDLKYHGAHLLGKQPAHRFAYVGSVGPLELTPSRRRDWHLLGRLLTCEFGLRGIFGVDTIVTDQGELVPIEVNPRYTSSMELLEGSLPKSVVQYHVEACGWRETPGHHGRAGSGALSDDHGNSDCSNSDRVRGKAVLYAPGDALLAESVLDSLLNGEGAKRWDCEFADIPPAGIPQQAGRPVLTVLCEGASSREVAERLGLSGPPGLLSEITQALFGRGNEPTSGSP